MSDFPRAPLSVLVVDDLPDVAESVADLLTVCGHKVRTASCGTDALHAARLEAPDVVLLDIGLPGMSGWDVARRLRAQSTGKQPVVVAVTGYGTDRDRVCSADAGIDLHLTKPADPAQLTALLARVRGWLRPERSKGILPASIEAA
ncbi:putative transcriptional regulatory protein TcrX [Gemmata sp. SH-PL17]|uniref:response regulator n=1 Tax=Gemmata sp. SH-PL17 TaxID=1630693 RepID=UPI00078EAAB2|nr:response regulator [Gemmata sp. SH-PL17]AMV29406.1 putative transcriptional regulatory protein TcrX [Gemmata sp. SH-PL17]